ncbi:MAG: tetratricopeptide repeat protein [Pseudomonadales bacterium]|nr:tetratricopeptide repeat protein [Pseudomonadales bacterium]
MRIANLMFVVLVAACAYQPETDSELVVRGEAPLFDGMGRHHHAITTNDPGAQRYFDQGLVLSFAFNHAESIRSFRAAQRLDPDCAMCFWGEALATGPNINVTSNGKVIMSPDERMAAYAAIQKALALKGNASERERDYIDALATRYNGDPDTARNPLDIAYAEAMSRLAAKYPDDTDAASLYAEALMNTMPWNYWADDGNPKPDTVKVLSHLERVLDTEPDHPLAIHLYIHAVEASSSPERAEAPADRLASLVPGAGHLVHMPAHIYWRVGRYNDASSANIAAARVDEAYIAQCNAQGFYPALYYPHNLHFLWAASTMEGRSALSIDSAFRVVKNVSLEQVDQFPTVELFRTIPLLSYVRFAKWDEILAYKGDPDKYKFSTGMLHYARGVALAAQGDLDAASKEQSRLAALKDEVSIRFLDSIDVPASDMMAIANQLLQGEIAYRSQDYDTAIGHYEQAVQIQDTLPYTEPPFWYYPTRQSLGQALLDAGRPADAESVYRKDLEQYPRNGWSMNGLARSLEAQGKETEAAAAMVRFDNLWQMADVELSGSRL